MIQTLADKTARFIAKGDETADVEVLTYGYYMFYQQWITTIVILLLALVCGLFFPVLVSMVVSMTLRGSTGGTHATRAIICKIVAFVMAFAPALAAEVFGLRMFPIAFVVLYLLCIALIVVYVPTDTDVKKFTNPRLRKRMKIESLVLVSLFFAAAIFLQERIPVIAFVIAIITFVACSLVHPMAYWLFGFDPVTKEAKKSRW